MAEQSQFVKYFQKYLTGFVARVYKTINGEDKAPTYLHKTMLTPKQSVDGKWTSITSDNQNVVADVVAMDSPLPLKSRPALSSASGDIPKIGMELKMNENQLDLVDTLIAKNAPESEIVAELFDDTKRCVVGVEEQKEYLFLRGFSSGVALTDDDNVGTGIRVDYGYLSDNKDGVSAAWTDAANATPISDLKRSIDKADSKGKTITNLFIDKKYYELARQTKEVKDLYAVFVGNFGTTKPAPSSKDFMNFLETELGLTVTVINRSVKLEKDKKIKTVKAWDEGKIILTTGTNVGQLVWKRVVEDSHRSEAVNYTNGEFGALISKYVTHKPFGEFTDIQARQVPVINNVDQIFQIDAKVVNTPTT